MGEILHTKLKEAKLAKNSDLNTVSQHPNNNKEKIENCKRLIWIIFLVKPFLYSFQNMFIYQPTFITLELKTARSILLVGNQKRYIIPNCLYYIVFSCII